MWISSSQKRERMLSNAAPPLIHLCVVHAWCVCVLCVCEREREAERQGDEGRERARCAYACVYAR